MDRNHILRQIKLTLKLSIGSILFASVIGLITWYFRNGDDALKMIFNANYIAGALILTYGILSLFVPFSLLKTTRVVDYSNVADVLKDEKESKDSVGFDHIYWGIAHMFMISLIEVIIFYIV